MIRQRQGLLGVAQDEIMENRSDQEENMV